METKYIIWPTWWTIWNKTYMRTNGTYFILNENWEYVWIQQNLFSKLTYMRMASQYKRDVNRSRNSSVFFHYIKVQIVFYSTCDPLWYWKLTILSHTRSIYLTTLCDCLNLLKFDDQIANGNEYWRNSWNISLMIVTGWKYNFFVLIRWMILWYLCFKTLQQ